jgi:hypothetical protein
MEAIMLGTPGAPSGQPNYLSASRSSDAQRIALRKLAMTNIIMVGAVMTLTSDPWISLLLGAGTIAVAAIRGANAARRRLTAISRHLTLLDVVLAWLPGFVALMLALVALAFVVKEPNGDLLRQLGIGLFMFQIGIIVIFDTAPSLDVEPLAVRS